MQYLRNTASYLRAVLRHRVGGEDGAAMVEYGLLVALIAVVVIAALTPLGQAIAGLFDGVTNDLDNAGSSG